MARNPGLRIVLSAVLAGAVAHTARDPTAATQPRAALSYTAGLRGHVAGLARRATVVDRARATGSDILQLDAGDLSPPSTPEGQPGDQRRPALMLAAAARMGIDVVTPGETDLVAGPERFAALARSAHVTVVATNLLGHNGKRPFLAHHLVPLGARSVGVFGLIEGWNLRTTDPVAAAREAVVALKAKGASLIVGLFHLAGGQARATEILAAVSGVNVVVLGHASTEGAPRIAGVAGQTSIVEAGDATSAAGVLDVVWPGTGTPGPPPHHVTPLAASVPEQLGVGLLLQLDAAPILPQRKVPGAQKAPAFETWDYASNDACVLCHAPAFEQWKTTDHAHALATLIRKKRNHDAACLGCHSVGFLQPGGTRSLETATTFFANVGCESCHGPGVGHVRSVDKKKGTARKVPETVCLGCHTADQTLGPFEYAKAVKEILGPGHGAPSSK